MLAAGRDRPSIGWATGADAVAALGRRAFLQTLGLAPLVALQSCATELQRASTRSQIEYGPASFEVDRPLGAGVASADRAGSRADRVRDHPGSMRRPLRTPAVAVTADSDLTATVALDRLVPIASTAIRAEVEGAADLRPLGHSAPRP